MKILIVTTFVPPEIGGAEKVAYDTSKQLSKIKGNEVHLLTTTKDYIKNFNIIVHRIPNYPLMTLFFSTIGFNQIKKILIKNEFDIIHAHMTLPWGFVFRNVKTKKLITMHGCEYINKNFLFKIFAKLAYKRTDLIFSPSYWLSEYVKNEYGYNSIVVPNGLDTSKYKMIKNIKKEKNVILFVGRLIKIKGVYELIQVAKELKNFEFWFVGKGPLQKLINLPNTKYLGYLSEETLIRVYNKATICVFPSYKENFPIVGLEALACGKATIATKFGYSEIIDNNKNGLLINAKNPTELKNAIKKLMGNSGLRKKFQENARKKALQFDNKKIIQKHYSLYKKLLKAK